MSKSQRSVNGPEKTDLFDRIAEAFGFETVEATGRKPRFRYEELTRVYDRLNDLGHIRVERQGDEDRSELRSAVSRAFGLDPRGGRPIPKGGMREIARILTDDDVVTDGGTVAARPYPDPGANYPTDDDLDRASDLDGVYPWVDPEESVCVSRRQNSTRYHTLWTVRDGEPVPACKGHSPSNGTEHRLAPEDSIKRTKEECHYCENEELRL